MKHKMKTFFKRVIATACAVSMVLGGMLSDLGTVTAKAAGEHTLWLVGDSTVCAFNDAYYYPRYGYGTKIGEYLDDTFTVQNLALSGRSSKSFLSETNYKTLTNGIQAGDVLVIGFGHNDEKGSEATYTNPNGNWETEGSFAKSLYDNYVSVARDKDAEVILCTPIVRRTTGSSFSDSQLHITTTKDGYEGGDYPEAIRQLGKDKNVPVVDLTDLTKALYTELTPTETLYLHAWTSNKEGSVDDTHLNEYGAMRVAWLFADAVRESNATSLASHVVEPTEPWDREIQLKANPDYKEPEYSGELEDSKIFADYVIGEGDDAVHFKGTAFGDIGGNPSASNFTLGSDEAGNMRIAEIGGKGKIASGSDGIAMYYYKLPASSRFTFSARATVNSLSSDSQAAFGLMARDDMYIDKNDSSIKSDYVAAGTLGSGVNCFYRKNGALGGRAAFTKGTTLAEGYSYDLKIVGNGDGYECTFGNEDTQIGGYDFALTSVDSENVFIGMFANRKMDISFSNIYLEVDGEIILDVDRVEYDITVTSENEAKGTASASMNTAASGDTVTLIPNPNKGYLFKEWRVINGDVTIVNNQFIMPEGPVEIQAVFEELLSEWIFYDTDTNKANDSLLGSNGVKIEGETGSVAGLKIDATASGAKWDSTNSDNSNWVQVNKGTVIKVPVEEASRITLVFKDKNYTVDGVAADAATQSFLCKGRDGIITLVATENTGLQSIKVSPLRYIANGTIDFTDGAGANIDGLTVTGITTASDEHGLQTTQANATMVLTLSKEADITVLACKEGTAQSVSMTASSGTVTQEAVTESGRTGVRYTVKGAKAGDLTLTFGDGVSIHSIVVNYKRKIDVWDFGAKEETDTATYTNNITAEEWIYAQAVYNGKTANSVGKGGSFVDGTTTFGDLALTHNSGDRFYTNAEALSDYDYGYKSYAYATQKYDDDYTAGGAYYANGSGNASRRYITISNVQAGDKIVAYIGIMQTADSQFVFEGLGTAAGQTETVDAKVGEFKKYVFIAEKTGTYKIWASGDGKPMYHRIMRVPGVTVSGTIDFSGCDYSGTGYTVKFVNQTTKKETVAVLDGNNFTVTLAPGYEYRAVLSGALGYGFDADTKKLTTTETDGINGISGIVLKVEEKKTFTYSGQITGFAQDYDTTEISGVMVPFDNSDLDEADLTIDEDLKFTVTLESDENYIVQLSGVDDYEVTAPEVVNIDSDLEENITVALKAMYDVKGGFIGLAEGTQVTGLTFTRLAKDDDGNDKEEKYVYAAEVTADGYSIKLRDGSYLAKATVEDYSTKTHVVVDGKAVTKDLMFVSTTAKPAQTRVSDIYVGYPDKQNNYATVSEAVEACAAMNPKSETERITVHIAPGTYREQIILETPYVSFVNDTDEEVLLTWYYGIGYKYYSADTSGSKGKGFYNPENAHDKYEKHEVDRWGVAVYVKSTATAFRAKGITFENSFNRYITDEELEDGVEVSGSESITFVRKYGADVQSRTATERAAAIEIDADEAEFMDCAFYSSQDTLYTSGAHIYFKNCLIEGQTDYIYGSGNAVFDACELSWKGYSGASQGGYITAAQTAANGAGYLFRNCTITANDKLTVTGGYFGRPWGADAGVTFLNTKLQSTDLIVAEGWTAMSGNQPENARFREYNTTALDGKTVNTSSRTAGTVIDKAAADAVKVTDYFGSWTPAFYQEEEAEVKFKTNPSITNNGDLNTPYPGNTLTVHYSLGEANDANDASLIQWYSVKDGKETLVKGSTATAGKTYKITTADVGSQIKVVVTPITVSGNMGEAASVTVKETVREGYEDPDASGGSAELGDGINIFLAGDSTVKDYSSKSLTGSARNEGAWGEFFQSYFDSEKVTVINYANGGRSSRSFINEGSLKTIEGLMGKGDYLFIQFGHNDSSDGAEYLDERYVPLGDPVNGIYPTTAPAELNGNYTYDCGGTFKWYLLQYIEAARKAGATPVLVTPVSRMYYNADGTIRAHHDSSTTSNNAYVTAVKQLAEEQDVLLVDGFELTKKLFEDAYKADGNNNDTYGRQIMYYDEVNKKADSTHNNKLGGMIEAAAIVSVIQDMDLDISYAVKAPRQVLGETTDGTTVFSVNNSSKLTAYDINTGYAERAPYWEGVGQDMIDAIAKKANELGSKPGGSGGSGDSNEPGEGLKVKLVGGDEYTYTGSAIKPEIEVTNNGELLIEGADYTVKYKNNVKAGVKGDVKKSPSITVTGKGNLTGSNTTTFTINKKNIDDEDVKAGAIIVASGSKATPILVYNGVKLGNKDFTNPSAATKFSADTTITIEGQGNFEGTRELEVKVVDKSALKKFTVTVGKDKLYFDPDNTDDLIPTITVNDKSSKLPLTEDEDYIIVPGADCLNAGTVKVTVVGMGEYSGTVTKSYKINPLSKDKASKLEGPTPNTDGYTFVSTGVTLGDDMKVTYKGEDDTELVLGKDYKVSYSSNKKVGTGKYTISFLGNYKGISALKGTFTINAAALDTEGTDVTSPDMTYKKANIYKSKPYVTIDGVALKASDYTVEYYVDAELTTPMDKNHKIELTGDETSATVYVKVIGKKNYDANTYATGEYKVSVASDNAHDMSKAKITFYDESNAKLKKLEYTGEAVEPAKVVVEIKGAGTLVEGTDFEVTYVNNVNKGKATAVINGIGDYAGGKTATYSIVAKNVKALSNLFTD